MWQSQDFEYRQVISQTSRDWMVYKIMNPLIKGVKYAGKDRTCTHNSIYQVESNNCHQTAMVMGSSSRERGLPFDNDMENNSADRDWQQRDQLRKVVVLEVREEGGLH